MQPQQTASALETRCPRDRVLPLSFPLNDVCDGYGENHKEV